MSFWLTVILPGVIVFVVVLTLLIIPKANEKSTIVANPIEREGRGPSSDNPFVYLRKPHTQNELWWGGYHLYMQSTQWREKRQRILARDGFRCRDCGSRTQLEVHHERYDSLGDETGEDLRTLCRECHTGKHPDRPMVGGSEVSHRVP